jgi:hypothetical protein
MDEEEIIPIQRGDIGSELAGLFGNVRDESASLQAIKELSSGDKNIKLKSEIKDLSDNYYISRLFGVSMLMCNSKHPRGWEELRIIAEEELKTRVSLGREGRKESVKICAVAPQEQARRGFFGGLIGRRM